MDAKCHAVRYVLSRADPMTAINIVRTFGLPAEEEECIILRDVKWWSLQQVAIKFCTSTETVKRRRRSGYLKIVDALNI